MARDTGADSEVRATIDKKLGNVGVGAFEVGQGVKDRRLSAGLCKR